MLGWTDLKLEMACSWKVVWNVDPLPLSVPESLAPLLLDALPVAELLPLLAGVDEELDEEHAARDRAVATAAAPTVATRCLRPSGISGTPYRFYMFPRPHEQPRQPVSVQTVACQYSLPARMVPAGKQTVDRCGLEG